METSKKSEKEDSEKEESEEAIKVTKLYHEYQIIKQDGTIWQQAEIRAKVVSEYSASGKKMICKHPDCTDEDCRFKTKPGDSSSVTNHLLKMVGAVHYCVPCGKLFVSKQTLIGHALNCKYQARVRAVHEDIDNPEQGKEKIIDFELYDENTNIGPKCMQFIKKLLEIIKKDGHMKEKTIDELLAQLKNSFDPNFTGLITFINKYSTKTNYKVQL